MHELYPSTRHTLHCIDGISNIEDIEMPYQTLNTDGTLVVMAKSDYPGVSVTVSFVPFLPFLSIRRLNPRL